MIRQSIKNSILSRFFKISLTSHEESLAIDAVDKKYVVAVRQATIFSFLLLPALLLIDTSIVISVLIPTTMVAGTAWFSVSLASIKAKFEDFGMELTTDLFVAFTLSLLMLFWATVTSLTQSLWIDYVEELQFGNGAILGASFLAIVVVGKLIFSIFSGSLKYDVNDAMLTGQNEAAERFFKTSLSVLHNTSLVLKNGRSLHVANYSIGVAFFEVYSSIRRSSQDSSEEKLSALIDKANELVNEPSMQEERANIITIDLTSAFLHACQKSIPESIEHKSFVAVTDEISCLKRTNKLKTSMQIETDKRLAEELQAREEDNNTLLVRRKIRNELEKLVVLDTDGAEDQEMTDLRISVILTEIANLIEEFGYRIKID